MLVFLYYSMSLPVYSRFPPALLLHYYCFITTVLLLLYYTCVALPSAVWLPIGRLIYSFTPPVPAVPPAVLPLLHLDHDSPMPALCALLLHTHAYISIRKHTSAYVSSMPALSAFLLARSFSGVSIRTYVIVKQVN